MTKIKICGITDIGDAKLAAELGAEMLGFNFYEKSKRYISPEDASLISDGLNESIVKIGVFVNASLHEIELAHCAAGLDGVQLHGDETPDFIAQLRDRLETIVIKAVRIRSASDAENLERFEAEAILFDAHSGVEFGGTGETFDWSIARNVPGEIGQLFLAGGLNADNVADAIRMVRPYAVDVASGVESSPGKKDPKKLEAFIKNAKIA